MEEKSGNNIVKNDKPLYKLKMLINVPSKVTEGLKMFKSYRPPKKKIIIEKIKIKVLIE